MELKRKGVDLIYKDVFVCLGLAYLGRSRLKRTFERPDSYFVSSKVSKQDVMTDRLDPTSDIRREDSREISHTSRDHLALISRIAKKLHTSIAALGSVPYSLYKPATRRLIFRMCRRDSPLNGSELPA